MNENRLLILNVGDFFSFGGVITVSGKPCERQIEAPNCKAETLLEHNCEPRWRDIDVQSRCAVRMFERGLDKPELVSRVVYKLAFDRDLESLSFFLSPFLSSRFNH